eukprot:c38900_g1_i1 orf=3-428(+)
MGDFNMVEQELDRRGGTNSTIHGAEKDAWERFKWKLGLLDKSMTDPRVMMWNNGRVEGRIEARLDRTYMSEGGSWLVGNVMCKVELGEVLSDHKPVVLDGKIQGEVRWSPGYFKVNTTLLETKEGKDKIESALGSNMPWLG